MAGKWNPWRELGVKYFVVRTAKSKSKCVHGCTIERHDVVLITSIHPKQIKIRWQNGGNVVHWDKLNPKRYCGKHAISFLRNLYKNVDDAFSDLDELDINIYAD